MRKILSSSILCAFFLAASSFAQVSVSIPDTSVNSSSTVLIPVSVSDLTGLDVISYNFDLIYDNDIVSATGYSTTGTLSSGLSISANTSKTDTLTISAGGIFPLSGNGVLINLQFQTPSSPGVTRLIFDGFDFNEGNPTASLTNGSIGVDSEPLPVELSLFTFSQNKNTIELTWTTTSEINNYGFEIERAETDLDYPSTASTAQWIKIGFVRGNGTTTVPKKYWFMDDLSQLGENITRLKYRLKQIDTNGKFQLSHPILVILQPFEFELSQNYPNPFNSSCLINYTIPQNGFVSLKIYDCLGREINAVLNESFMIKGRYQSVLDLVNLPTGIYYYRLNFSGFNNIQETKKMLLIE